MNLVIITKFAFPGYSINVGDLCTTTPDDGSFSRLVLNITVSTYLPPFAQQIGMVEWVPVTDTKLIRFICGN